MPKREIRQSDVCVARREETDFPERCGSVQAYTRNAKSLCPRHHSAEPWDWRLTGGGLNCPSLRCRSAHQFRTLAPTVPIFAPTVVPGDLFRRSRVFAVLDGVVTARGLRCLGVCRPQACFSVGLQQLKPTTNLSISRRLGSVLGRDPGRALRRDSYGTSCSRTGSNKQPECYGALHAEVFHREHRTPTRKIRSDPPAAVESTR
jgi:hypothetical protein